MVIGGSVMQFDKVILNIVLDKDSVYTLDYNSAFRMLKELRVLHLTFTLVCKTAEWFLERKYNAN